MPSELHNDLIRRALVWLSYRATQRGIRCCSEVILGDGYVADGAAVLGLQFGYLTDFIKGYHDLRVANGWPDTDDFSFVIESKVSKSDFDKTFKHKQHGGDRMKPRANFHFIVTTEKVREAVQSYHTDFWGIMVESRTGVRIVKMPVFCPHPIEHLHEFAYRILRYTKHGKYSDWDMRQDYFFQKENIQTSL
jgi:hypothetical protein